MAGPDAPPALAVTMGEPAGIGIEITLAAWRDRRQAGLPPFFVLGCPDMIARRAGEIGIEVPIAPTTPEDVHAVFDSALPVVPIEAAVRGIAGVPDPDDARAVIGSIETAVEFCHQGRASAVVTNPIQKKSLYDAGFSYPGHTEFLGVLAEKWGPGPWRPVMMLAGPELRTVPVTGHIALGKVPARLTSDRIVAFGRITARELEHQLRDAGA